MAIASYPRLGHARIAKESVDGTLVRPDDAIEILSESVVINMEPAFSEGFHGNRALRGRPLANHIGPFSGTMTVALDARNAGRFLTGCLGAAASNVLEAGKSIAHVWEGGKVAVAPTYSIEFAEAGLGYAVRLFGVKFATLEFSNADNNQVQLVIGIEARRAYLNARVLTDASSGTTLTLDQTSGLAAGDTLLVLNPASPAGTPRDTLIVASITDETHLEVTGTITDVDEGDYVVVQSRPVADGDFARDRDFIFAGGCVALAGKPNPDALQKLAARANVEAFSVNLTNGVRSAHSATGCNFVDRMPATILFTSFAADGTFGEFRVSPEWRALLRERSGVALRYRFCGKQLDDNADTAAVATLTSSGAGTVVITLDGDAEGEGGNDWAVRVLQGDSTLSVTVSGKLITVILSSTSGNNAVATVAAAIDAALGTQGSAAETSTGNVVAQGKKYFAGGRDANETAVLQIDIPFAVVTADPANMGDGDVLMDDVTWQDARDERLSGETAQVRVLLRNDVTSY